MNMFYLIDTSDSMEADGNLARVNDSMPEIVEILAMISDTNHDQSDIYISCITYGTQARLIYDMPVLANDFRWAPIHGGGGSNLGDAFELLSEQMRRGAALSSADGHLRPAVILLTDGFADHGWEVGLARLHDNRWFRESYKIVIALGADAAEASTRRAIASFAEPLDAGGEPTIVAVDDVSKLREVIRLVSATVSRIGTSCGSTRERATSAQISQALRSGIEPLDGVYVPPMNIDSPLYD